MTSHLVGSISGITEVWIAATSASAGGGGTLTSVSAGVGLTSTPNPITTTGEISLTNTGVSAGSYSLASLTVDAQGRLIAVSNGSASGTGTVTAVSAGVGLSASPNPITGTGEIFLTNTGVSAGDYVRASITVDAQGRITAASNGAAGVTSVAVSGKNGITVAGSPITGSGTIDLALGQITPTGVTTGVVSASTLNVTGDVQAATGRVTVSAATISGLLSGAAASFSGVVSANAGVKSTTGTFSSLVSADGGINTTVVSGASINVTGDVRATTGRLLVSAATITGLLTGVTATFSGIVSANAGLKATTGSFSGLVSADAGVRIDGSSELQIRASGNRVYSVSADAIAIEGNVTTNIGKVGDTTFGDNTLRAVRPAFDQKIDLGTTSIRYHDIYLGNDLNILDDGNLVIGTATGSMIGQSTSLIGFFGATPVVKRATYTQTYSSASRSVLNNISNAVVTTSATNITPFGYTEAQANAIVTAINSLRNDVNNVKNVVNSLIDDGQALGLIT